MSVFENCEGCNGKCNTNMKACNNEENQICPCTTCMVKMMCCQPCKDYYIYQEKSYKFLVEHKRFVITAVQSRG